MAKTSTNSIENNYGISIGWWWQSKHEWDEPYSAHRYHAGIDDYFFIDGDGAKPNGLYWDDEPISIEALEVRLQQQSASGKDPSIQLRADKEGKYDTVAQVLAAASQAGLTKVAFVNE